MLVELPPKLEKVALEYFSGAFRGEPSPNCEITNASPRLVALSAARRLQGYADCFFVAREIKAKRRIFLCPASRLAELFDEVVLQFDIVSVMNKDGALTFSADEAIEDRSLELHFIGSGLFAAEVEKLADEFFGVVYF
jgi:hypothetical protein